MTAVGPVRRFVLEGRLVTMAPAGVVDAGAIYIDDGMIEAVTTADQPAPDPKYDDAPLIRTGGTIYPGLIELHNHLSYNAIPLWDVPKLYTNNGQWRGTPEYTRQITKPSQVLGQTPGAAQALVRYVECRALLGGVTTSQGITLASAGGLKKYYRGLIRNAESPDHPDLPPADTKVANPVSGGARVYLDSFLTKNTCYLQHLSEGIDDTARGWFLNLRIDDTSWAVNDVLCGIHSTALRKEDFEVLAGGGASVVWSPLSNYLLYGETTDIAAAKTAGVNIALGSDWAPSGSKNLLGELKVAWLASREAGDVFTPEELVAMATVNPARAAKWDHLLGTIEAGTLADLIVVNGRSGDAYVELLTARETTVTLVVIGGVPRVGQKRLMERFWPHHHLDDVEGVDHYDVARSTRYLYLIHEDDLLDGLPLSTAVDELTEAMQQLPKLAGDVDDGLVAPLTAAGTVAIAGGIPEHDGQVWRVVADFEDEDIAAARASGDLGILAQPYRFWVTEPIDLDPITVAEDGNYLRRVAAAGNVPDHIRHGLPELH